MFIACRRVSIPLWDRRLLNSHRSIQQLLQLPQRVRRRLSQRLGQLDRSGPRVFREPTFVAGRPKAWATPAAADGPLKTIRFGHLLNQPSAHVDHRLGDV